MNTIWEVAPQAIAQRVGWALLHSLWQGALVGVVFALVRLAGRGASANARYLAGCLCLGLALAGPVLTVGYCSRSARTLNASRALDQVSGAWLTVANDGSGSSSVLANRTFSLLNLSTEFLGRQAPLLAGAWFLGVTICVLKLTRGCWRVRQLRIRDNEPADLEWIERLNDLRLRLGISRSVCLLKSAMVQVPTVIGWLRPMILLPAATLTGLTPAQLDAILAHELAHVRRLDSVVNAFQCVVETLMFYHPVVWWISRCVREERENCCDDLVLEVCEDRLVYAHALARLEQSRAEPGELAFAASGGSLLRRVRRLLGVANDRGHTGARHLCGLALLGIGLLFIALGFYLGLGPAKYRAVARIRVEPDLASPSPSRNGEVTPGGYDPYFIQTEFEVIHSEAVLGKVIADLHLNREWGRKYANGEALKTAETMQLLKNRMDLRPVRNTSLIEIAVFSENRDEAARIANGIAESHQDYRFRRQKLSREGMTVLAERQKQQEAKVHDAQIEVENLRERLQIDNQVVQANDPIILSPAESSRRMEGLRIETLSEVVRLEALLNRLKKLGQEMGKEQLAEAIPTAAQDLLLSGLLERRTLAEQRLLVAQKEYGPEHTEVKNAVSQVEDLKTRINDRVDGILLGLDAKVGSLKEGLQKIEEEVAKAKTNDLQQASQSRHYLEAKRNLEELQRFKQILEMKMAAENLDASGPRMSVVEIVDMAQATRHPISPNHPRAAALILFGLLLEMTGLVLLKPKRDRSSNPSSAGGTALSSQ